MKINYIKTYFSNCGYAVSFEPNEYILIPNIFHDIYRGALGEAAGECILAGKIKVPLKPITDPFAFEKFDFVSAEMPTLYFDFKYWGGNYAPTEKEQVSKISEKLSEVKGTRAFIINIFLDDASLKPYWVQSDPRIFVVPSLLVRLPSGKYHTHEENCRRLAEAIKGVKNGN